MSLACRACHGRLCPWGDSRSHERARGVVDLRGIMALDLLGQRGR